MSSRWWFNSLIFLSQISLLFFSRINYQTDVATRKCLFILTLPVAPMVIETFIFVLVCAFVTAISFRRFELSQRKESLFGIAAIAQMEQANVLEALPDVIVIASKGKISYMNREAWKVLKCKGKRREVEDYENVTCDNPETSQPVPVLEQFAAYLKMIDGRLENISNSTFMETMISMATSEAKLIQKIKFQYQPEDFGSTPLLSLDSHTINIRVDE